MLSEYDKANVIGTRDVDKILIEHVLDSLSCLLFRPLADARRIVDVGSGGGLPAIPLQAILPDTSVTLLEATGKKSKFLSHAIRQLGLDSAQVLNARVEDVARQVGQRAMYDVSTVRAVSRLSVIAEYCVPLLRVGGCMVAMKGRVDREEWEEGERAAQVLGGRISEVIEVPLVPEMGGKTRRLVVLEKVAGTPERYPRKTGVPTKNPLGKS